VLKDQYHNSLSLPVYGSIPSEALKLPSGIPLADDPFLLYVTAHIEGGA